MNDTVTEHIRETPVVTAKSIAVVTCCNEDWGGSEELWARCIPYLQADKCHIKVYKAGINPRHPEYIKLVAAGVTLENLTPDTPSLPFRVYKKISNRLKPSAQEQNTEEPSYVFAAKLRKNKPDMVIISQGINFDGVQFAQVCIDLGIRYVMVAQKAVDFYWPYYSTRDLVINAYKFASQSFFVSRHNLRLTEEQLGMRLEKANVIFNPIKSSRKIIPYPSTDNGFKLACIGRYFLLDKGQDILIRILSREVWMNRQVQVNFIGAGHDKQALKEQAALLNVKNAAFLDFTNDIDRIWSEHHALILPSRSEGMPLVMLEAMAAGRTVIVSNAGGNAEIIQEGVSGFIGAPFDDEFEKAMEAAWSKRNDWKTIGENAAAVIKEKVPEHPEFEFANQIKHTIHG